MAATHDGASRVAVVSREGGRAGAVHGQAAGAADPTADGDVAGTVEVEGVASVGDGSADGQVP